MARSGLHLMDEKVSFRIAVDAPSVHGPIVARARDGVTDLAFARKWLDPFAYLGSPWRIGEFNRLT